jgi:RNA recognition motif-containing protein
LSRGSCNRLNDAERRYVQERTKRVNAIWNFNEHCIYVTNFSTIVPFEKMKTHLFLHILIALSMSTISTSSKAFDLFDPFGKKKRAEAEARANATCKNTFNSITLSNTSFDGRRLLTRVHNNSQYGLLKDSFTFRISAKDCVKSNCVSVGDGNYRTSLGERFNNVVSPGVAIDIETGGLPMRGEGIPNIRPQGTIRYSFQLTYFSIAYYYDESHLYCRLGQSGWAGEIRNW